MEKQTPFISSQDLQEELDEHLDAINRNTSEIQACFEYVGDVEKKVDKISEKIDTLMAMIQQPQETGTKVKPLSLREQEVFLALYTTANFLTYKQVAHKVSLPEQNIPQLIEIIIEKGVPILKKFAEGKVCVQIDPEFKNEQAKHNVLQIDSIVMQEFSN